MLAADARAGVVDLASRLGISRNTVQARLQRLEEGGLLTGYRPELKLAEAGVSVEAFIGLEVQQGRLASIIDALVAMPQCWRFTRRRVGKIFWCGWPPRLRPVCNS